MILKPEAPPLILDQWGNFATGAGTRTKDKRSAFEPRPQMLSSSEAFALYSASATAQIIVDEIANEMTREWLDVTIPGDEEKAELIGATFDDLDLQQKVNDALTKQRLFGGGALLMLVDDGIEDLSLPLNETGLKSVRSLVALEPDECVVQRWVIDPLMAEYGQPLSYSINPKVIGASAQQLSNVHASRVLRFIAPAVTRLTLNAKRGWGVSSLDAVWPVIRTFDTGFDSASILTQDFAQAVYKLRGLAQAVAADRAGLIKSRLELIDYSRSSMRAIALDADQEDFERKATPLTGLPEILDRFCNLLSMASRIPVTRLMGQSPAGLNATGDADERNFQMHCKSLQVKIAQQPIERLTRLIMLSKEGPTNGAEPENWAITWRPLSQPTEDQKSATHFTQAQADQIYLLNGVLAADEIRSARFGGDRYSLDTSVEAESTGDDVDDLSEEEGTTRIDPKTGQPAQMPTGATGSNLQATALNGAQVSSALEIVKSFNAGEVSRESAVSMLVNFFQLSPEAADQIVGQKIEPKPEPKIGAPSMPSRIATPPQNESK